MNQLSWLIYLADVANNLRVVTFVLLLACVAGLVVGGIVLMAANDDRYRWDADDKKRYGKWAGRYVTLIFVGVFMLVGRTILPTKETVYAIAASELGEQALKSPTVVKATKALDAWLDTQIAKVAPPTTNPDTKASQ